MSSTENHRSFFLCYHGFTPLFLASKYSGCIFRL
jgi:hypothetical protein